MTNWPRRKLEELVTITRGSSPRPIADERYFIGGIIPWIKIADATKSGKYLYKTKEHVNEFGASFSKRLPPGTILVAASGTLGYTQILGIEGCAHDGWLILQELREIDRDFLYYALKTMERHFYNSAYGAAIQNINTDILRQTEIYYPPLNIQCRIGNILSAYDDLIQNNMKRITILEEIARRIFEEWFVHFRTPGHLTPRFVESPLGLIPEGWRIANLQSLTAKIGSGATPKGGKEAYKAEGISLIRSLNVYDYKFEYSGLAFIDDTQATQLDNVTVLPGDILLNITGASVARCCRVPSNILPARVNQHVAIVRADGEQMHSTYLLDAINTASNKQKLLNFARGGATREALTKETIEKFTIVVPPREVLMKHAEVVTPIHLLRDLLVQQNDNLRAQRDLLLPKLISGEIDVGRAEHIMEAAE